MLIACTPPTTVSDKQEPFSVLDQTVVLKKSHILSIQTQLYQPSFEINGVILPHHETEIATPHRGMLAHLFVKAGQKVKKDEILASILPVGDFGNPNQRSAPLLIKAPFSGIIHSIYHNERASLGQHTPIFLLTSNEHYFSGLVPTHLKNDLSIGQSVRFSINDDTPTPSTATPNNPDNTLGGQIATLETQDPPKETPNAHSAKQSTSDLANLPTSSSHTPPATQNKPWQLHLTATIKPSSTIQPAKGQHATAHITNNTLQVGVLVPAQAIIGTVRQLEKPPHKPALPLLARIWGIRQNGQLHLATVLVIEYRPNSARYLVSGIDHDNLIVIADLPDNANGKQVIIRWNILLQYFW